MAAGNGRAGNRSASTAAHDAPEASSGHTDLPVFDLDTFEAQLPRERVLISGLYYVLACDEDMSAVQRENVRRAFLRMREIELLPAYDEGLLPADVTAVYDRLGRYICEVALLGPDAETVVSSLSPAQQNGLRRHFLERIDLVPLMVDLMRIAMRQLNARATAIASASNSSELDASESNDDDPSEPTPSASTPATAPDTSAGSNASSAPRKPRTKRSSGGSSGTTAG